MEEDRIQIELRSSKPAPQESDTQKTSDDGVEEARESPDVKGKGKRKMPMEEEEVDDHGQGGSGTSAKMKETTPACPTEFVCTTESSSEKQQCECSCKKIVHCPPTRFPKGFRFVPYDYELIRNYLIPKLNKKPPAFKVINEVHVYDYHPKPLIGMYREWEESGKWYFFLQNERKYPNGSRPSRTTKLGYWKATGADTKIMYKGKIIGLRKALVFYKGESGKGDKSKWVMHEYTACEPGDITKKWDEFVLCTIQRKRGAEEILDWSTEESSSPKLHQEKKFCRRNQNDQQYFNENRLELDYEYSSETVSGQTNLEVVDAEINNEGYDMLYDPINNNLEPAGYNISMDEVFQQELLFPLSLQYQNYQPENGFSNVYMIDMAHQYGNDGGVQFHGIAGHNQNAPVQFRSPSICPKMNIAAEVSSQKASCGIILKNSCGQVTHIAGKAIVECSQLEADAQAVLFGIDICNKLSFEIVILEGDNLDVITLLSENETPPKQIQETVMKCRNLLGSSPNYKMEYVGKERNASAHLVASYALVCNPDFIYNDLSECPRDFLVEILDVIKSEPCA